MPMFLKVFTITGRGTVATGRIERGKVKLQDTVEVIGYNKVIKSTVTGIEMFKQMMDYGEAGDQVGILLRGVKRDEVRRGMALTTPKSASMHNFFKAQVSPFARYFRNRALDRLPATTFLGRWDTFT